MKVSIISLAKVALLIFAGYAIFTNKSFIDESKTLLDTLKPFEAGVATVVEGDERARVDIADKKVRTVTVFLDSDKQMKMFVVLPYQVPKYQAESNICTQHNLPECAYKSNYASRLQRSH